MKRCGGWSLAELMLVTAVLGVLLGLATPGYRQHVMRAHRVAAIGQLVRVAQCQERQRSTATYRADVCLPAPSKSYEFHYVGTVSATTGFEVRATPIGAQSADGCGALRLDDRGARHADGPGADAGRCWSGR